MSLVPSFIDPHLTVTIPFELVPMEGNEQMPDALRHVYCSPDFTSIFVPIDLIGRNKVASALGDGSPHSIIPVCENLDGTLCIRIDWLKDHLPEYASIWANIEMTVDRARANI